MNDEIGLESSADESEAGFGDRSQAARRIGQIKW